MPADARRGASTLSRTAPAESTRGDLDASRVFDEIGHSDLIGEGKAFVLSLAAIKTALGPRWAPRRGQVLEVAERLFHKYLAPDDLWLAIGETHVLIVTPDTEPVMARAVCYRALKELLTFFLGEVAPEQIEVSRITVLSSDRMDTLAYTVDELEQADLVTVRAPVAAPPPSSLSNLNSWPLTTADGQNLRVSFAVEPVMNLKAWAMAGHRIESRILNLRTGQELSGRERRLMLPRDFEKIDLAALDRGMSRLQGEPPTDRARLIIQISFASLSNGRARSALLHEARDMQANLRQGAICELVDVEAGLPMSRLVEIASLVKEYFRGMFVQVEPKANAVEAALGAKAFGLTVRAADLGYDAASIGAGMLEFAALLKGRSGPMTVTSVPESSLLVNALAAGFSHATLRAGPGATPAV